VIRISGREEDGMFVLVYEDDGTGIPEPEKAKLFNPDYPEYRQIFIVHEILDITGITIRETGDPAKGARFEIRIPRGIYRYLRRTCDKTE
jgi:signal transduction histidine kinase